MSNALKISTVANPAPPQAPPPPGVQWINVQTAAQRSGLDESSIRRLCAKEWFRAGLARQKDGRAWKVREDADSRLARVQPAGAVVENLDHLTDDARKKMFWKKSLLAEWDTFSNSEQCRGFGQEQVDRAFLDLLEAGKLAVKLLPGMKFAPTDRTLRRWRGKARAGVSLLVDGRSTRYQDEPPAEDPFFECFKGLYLVQQAPDLTFCHKMATYQAVQNGWGVRSLSQTYRFVATIPKGVLELCRGGKKRFNDKCAPFIKRDYAGLRVNQIWNADHHRFDVMVTHEGKTFRPWLTAIQDVRTRMIVGWQITNGGNTQSILAAMARAVDAHGIPEQVYFDLGRDFASRAIGGVGRKQLFSGRRKDADQDMIGVCGMLDIKVVHCQPYHGQSKPIERFFGTMEQFAKTNPTYCGNSPANRPENLVARLKRNAAPELADFAEYFRLWVSWHNECHEHHGDGMDGQSPAMVFDSLIQEKRVVRPEIRPLIFWKPVMAKVGRNGVTCNRLVYELADRVWMQWQGKQVSIRVDPNDANRASVHDPEGRFLCMARCIEKLPWDASQEKVAAAIASNKRKTKMIREYHKSRPRISGSIAEEMQELQIEESRRKREAQQATAPIVVVSTPMDGQHQQIERALGISTPPPTAAHKPKLIDMLAMADDLEIAPAGGDQKPKLSMATFFDEEPAALPSRFIYESDSASAEPEECPIPTWRELGEFMEARRAKEDAKVKPTSSLLELMSGRVKQPWDDE